MYDTDDSTDGTATRTITPRTAMEMYLQERESDLSENTITSQRYTIQMFVRWCEDPDQGDIETLAEADGHDLHRFRVARGKNLTQGSLRGQLLTTRKYLAFAESIGALEEGVADKMMIPAKGGRVRGDRLDAEQASLILDHLDRFEYASRDHALLRVLWVTAIRQGTARGFDVKDFNRDDQSLAARHRPDTGTTLKNGEGGERLISLDNQTVTILSDYVDEKRIEVTDDHGRRPLFTTKNGRTSQSTMLRRAYSMTRPCKYGEPCPHDRDPDECKGAEREHTASHCPSVLSPHAIRRGSISYWLAEGTPVTALSDRADVTERILNKHYDARSEEERMETRREFFD